MRAVALLLLFIILYGGYSAKYHEKKTLDWWETIIFYQIYPRSFADSDDDGIGDLNGITSNLEYFTEIGVGAIIMSAIFQSPMYGFGNDISDFYTIHKDYGTMEDFKNLITRADEINIKVVLDFIPNHTSNESMWFQEALVGNEKYYNYFIWQNGRVDDDGNRHPPNNWLNHIRGSAWEYKTEVCKYYFHQFIAEQPDLNYHNPDVIEEMKNILRFWLKKGVAGFRVEDVNSLYEINKELFGGEFPDEPLSGKTADPDSYDYLNHIYTQDQEETYYMVHNWREVLDEFKEKDGMTRVLMTEVYASIGEVVRYFGEGNYTGAQMPLNFALITDVDASSSAADLKQAIDKFLTYKPVNERANWVVGKHDTQRVASRFSPSLVDGINMMVLLLPGIAITYMGEELGMVDGYVSWEDTVDPDGCKTHDPIGYVNVSRDPERTPFQWSSEKNAGFSSANKTWLPVAKGYETLNVEAQKAADISHLKVYQALAELRQKDVFTHGYYESLALNKDVFVFKRWLKTETYLVVINLKGNDQKVDLTYLENVKCKVTVVIKSVDSSKNEGDRFDPSCLLLSGYEAIVFKFKTKTN